MARCQIYLPDKIVAELDRERGDYPRSRILRKLIIGWLRGTFVIDYSVDNESTLE